MINQDSLDYELGELGGLCMGIVDEVIEMAESMPPDGKSPGNADNFWLQFAAREAEQRTAVEDYSDTIMAMCHKAIETVQMDAHTTMLIWLTTPQSKEWHRTASDEIALSWSRIHQDIANHICQCVYDIAAELDKEF